MKASQHHRVLQTNIQWFIALVTLLIVVLTWSLIE